MPRGVSGLLYRTKVDFCVSAEQRKCSFHCIGGVVEGF